MPARENVDLFQDLSKPNILKGSPAVKQLQTELDQRKKKVEQLQESGKYEKRRQEHEKRISILEKEINAKMSEYRYDHVRGMLEAQGLQFKPRKNDAAANDANDNHG